jgi:hypothetical protein
MIRKELSTLLYSENLNKKQGVMNICPHGYGSFHDF